MKPKLSIISTLIEAFQLCRNRTGLVVALALFTFIPSTAISFGSHQIAALRPIAKMSHTGDIHEFSQYMSQQVRFIEISMVFSLVDILIQTVVGAVVIAAILSVLKINPVAGTLWPTVKASVRRYTWPLIILSVLLSMIAVVLTVPFTILLSTVGLKISASYPNQHLYSYFTEFTMALMAILYLIFIKYALADPLVVIEHMNPLPALRRSWQMTRGYFGYVAGCYVFVGTAEYFIATLFQNYESTTSTTPAQYIDLLFISVMQCYWIFLAWCMYWRIRDAENLTVGATLPQPPPAPAD